MIRALVALTAIGTFISGASKGLPAWVETDVANYAGEYTSYRSDGRERYVSSLLVIRQSASGWTASYRSGVGMNGVETASATVELKNVKVTGEGFFADPVPRTKAWQGFLPAAFTGRFVMKTPAKKDKGQIKHWVQLADRTLFLKREAPPKKNDGWD